MFFTISRKAAMLFLSNLLSNRKKGKDINVPTVTFILYNAVSRHHLSESFIFYLVSL